MAGTRIDDKIRRIDAFSKARGEAKYVCDYEFPDMLYARVVRSTCPRGRISRIILPEAPAGYTFVSKDDIPSDGKNELWMIEKDWKCFADGEVRYVGETIGLWCGASRQVCESLVRNTKVEYEVTAEPAYTIDDAIAVKGGSILPGKDDDIMKELHCEKGRPMDEVFAEADEIITEEIETGFQEHVHLETNSCIAMPEDDHWVIYATCQCPFYIRKAVAGVINVPPEKIVVRQTATGGAFGGKENFPDVLAGPVLVAAYKTHRPVKLIHDREEDMLYSVKRHPSKIIYKSAIKDGKLLGTEGQVYYNAGGYLSSSFVVIQRGVFHANGVYDIPNSKIDGYAMCTNTFPSDAFRGFGAPQSLFAIEVHLEHVAKKLGVDPAEFKRGLFIAQGGETITKGHIVEKVVLNEMMDQITEASDYWRKSKEYTPGCGKGIGISFYNHGGAFTGNGEQSIIKGRARLRKEGDRVEILCGQTEMGQGFQTVLRKIAASVLDIPMDDVEFCNPDTSRVPDSGPTAASRSTMVVGKLVERAALEMKERWAEGDFEVEKVYEHPEGHPWDQSTFTGDAYLGYGWGACIVEVEIDKATNEVHTVGIWSSHDIGHPIDELIIHGQVNGGIIQSLGYASMEKMDTNPRTGTFRQHSMSDYVIPTSMDFPKQEWFLVDNPYEWGPFGAKGMGELVFNGADAAYVDAVERAIGKFTYKIPLPPEDIEEALKDVR